MTGTRSFWLGIDIGGTKMSAVLFNSAFKIVAARRKKTRAHEGLRATEKRIAELIAETCEEAGISKSRLTGVGVGVPGTLDLKNGIVRNASNLGWTNVNAVKLFSRAAGCPSVVLNDADAGVLGECTLGAAKKSRCTIGIFIGTGIGGGCVYQGSLLQSDNLSVMEIGHIPLLPDGPLCGCGRRGCLEALAGRLAVASAASVAAVRGQAPALLALTNGTISEIRSNALAQSIAGGDVVVDRIVRNSAAWVGRAAGLAINLFGADTVLLGGGLVEALPMLYLEEARRAAQTIALRHYWSSCRIVCATLGDNAVAAGAAAHARSIFSK